MRDCSPPSSLGVTSRAGYRLHHLEVFNWGTFDQQVWRLDPWSRDLPAHRRHRLGKVDPRRCAHDLAHARAQDRLQQGRGRRDRRSAPFVPTSKGTTSPSGSRRPGARALSGSAAGRRTVLGDPRGLHQRGLRRDRHPGAGLPTARAAPASPTASLSRPPRSSRSPSTSPTSASTCDDLRKRAPSRREPRSATSSRSTPRHSRRLLGIRSEQALELFHQTVSMKSVGNLNDFVRDHMLEPVDATDRVRDDHRPLRGPHQGPRRGQAGAGATRQRSTRSSTTAAKYDAALADRAALERQRDGRAAVRRRARDRRCSPRRSQRTRPRASAAGRAGRGGGGRGARWSDGAREPHRGAGRAPVVTGIGELERLAQRGPTAGRAGAAVERVAGSTPRSPPPVSRPSTDAAGFAALSASVVGRRTPRLDGTRREAGRDGRRRCMAREQGLASGLERIVADELEQPGAAHQQPAGRATLDIRAQLCSDLGLTAEDLPFAGELLDVDGGPRRVARRRRACPAWLRALAARAAGPLRGRRPLGRTARRLTFRGRGARLVGARLVYERVPAPAHPAPAPAAAADLLLADCLEVEARSLR